jgi:hypothetical protein
MSWYRMDDRDFPPPMDGVTKVDLLYPYPRGRTIDCIWDRREGMWSWREPRWEKGKLKPESEWHTGCYPNMQPTHWMLAPHLPEDAVLTSQKRGEP